jgi:uncharacterized protein YjiS (DUF1127 family)
MGHVISLRPAGQATSDSGRLLAGLKRGWARVAHAAELMTARRALLGMDERMLKDLGISRAQAEFEATRSVWHQSAVAFPLHEDSWR